MQSVKKQGTQLFRHFIEEALYDGANGYFAKRANIFKLDAPLEFTSMHDIGDFQSVLHRLYKDKDGPGGELFHQIWHTPSELFQPYYAHAIGKYLIERFYCNQPLIIYEVGPGNGTLCDGITRLCDSLKIAYEYVLVEISARMHDLHREIFSGNSSIVLKNASFFDCERLEERPCVIIAMEVWDNLSQDVILFSDDGQIRQGTVETLGSGLFGTRFEAVDDPLVVDLIQAMDRDDYQWPALKWSFRNLLSSMEPECPTKWQYIPTGIYRFLNTVHRCFPNASLIVSDFDYLPGTTPGHGAPVVQTRYKGTTVNCSTLLLKKGLFDIFFPTDFALIQRLLKTLSGREGIIMKHKEFLKRYADCDKTRTRSGYNPMLDGFGNVSFLLA